MERGLENMEIGGIGQNIEKSLKDLRSLVVNQTSVNDYQLTLVGKTHNNGNTKTSNTQKNSKYKLRRDSNEIVQHMMNECTKLTKKNARVCMSW